MLGTLRPMLQLLRLMSVSDSLCKMLGPLVAKTISLKIDACQQDADGDAIRDVLSVFTIKPLKYAHCERSMLVSEALTAMPSAMCLAPCLPRLLPQRSMRVSEALLRIALAIAMGPSGV